MEDTTPTGQNRSMRKAGLVGGALGSIGLAVSIFALSATAGAAGPVLQADTEPAPVEDEAPPELDFDEDDFDDDFDDDFEAEVEDDEFGDNEDDFVGDFDAG